MKESSRRDNKYRSGSTLCRGSKERHTRWQINTPFPVASRGALNSNVRRMTSRSVCALNAPPTRFACSHYVGARWSEQFRYTWDCFALTSLHLLVSHMGHEMGLQVSWLWGLRELLHLWSGNWNDKDLKFLIWIGLKKKKKKRKTDRFFLLFFSSSTRIDCDTRHFFHGSWCFTRIIFSYRVRDIFYYRGKYHLLAAEELYRGISVGEDANPRNARYIVSNHTYF